jgi:hypothetical protein
MEPTSPKSKKAKKEKWQDRLDREDYEILEKIITFGNVMNLHGLTYGEAVEEIERGSLNLEPYKAHLPRPKTLEEGHVILKEGLREAYKVNPTGLVEAVAGGKGKGQVITGMVAQYGDVIPRDEIVSAFSLSLTDRYALRHLNKSYHLLQENGESVPVTPPTEGKNAVSSNAIEYFDPSLAGVVYHLQNYMNQTLKKEVLQHLMASEKQLAAGVKFTSLEAAKEKGYEPYQSPDGTRGFVRQRAEESIASETPEEGVEHEKEEETKDLTHALDADAVAERVNRVGQSEDEVDTGRREDEDREMAPSAPNEDDLMKEAESAAPSFVPTKPFDSNDMHREDLLFIKDLMEKNEGLMQANKLDPYPMLAAVTPELRNLELKKNVVGIITVCRSLPDHQDMVDAATEWPVEKRPLHEWMPEFYDHMRQNQNVVDEGQRAPDIGLVAGLLFNEAAPNPTIRDAEDRRESVEAAGRSMDIWRRHAPAEGLTAGERFDHSFLASKLHVQEPASENPSQFSSQMKKMGARWLDATFGVAGFDTVRNEFKDAMEKWDPMKAYFGETVTMKLKEMAINGVISDLPINDLTFASLATEPPKKDEEMAKVEASFSKEIRRRQKASDKREEEGLSLFGADEIPVAPKLAPAANDNDLPRKLRPSATQAETLSSSVTQSGITQ